MKFIKFLSICIIFLCNCNTKEMYAENLVNKIEIFQEKHNKLPDSVKDLGEIESENSPAYYIKIDNSNFKVWYGKGLGKSKVYYSKTKEWIDEY